MDDFHTVVVGTDGSNSSLRAVDRAAQLAGKLGARLIVATAYIPTSDHAEHKDYRTSGDANTYAILQEAKERAITAGASLVEERAVVGSPVDVLAKLAEEVDADLLVVGNVGINTITGRLLGSVPANVLRRTKRDVLVVHTSD
ncbi:MAG TPA: universal stress protein [Mycobacterium sp.]